MRASITQSVPSVMAVALVATVVACSGTDGVTIERSATSPEANPDEGTTNSPGTSTSDAGGPSGELDAATKDATPEPQKPKSHFECKKSEAGYRPFWIEIANGVTKDWSTTTKGLLGQNAMPTQAECDQARASANDEHGVICSRTGLDGWKPTLYTGTLPGRADFGYLGGSTIVSFADCLKATKNSSVAGVCFWGGTDWYVSPIDKEGLTKGPYATLDACVAQTKK